MATPYERPAPQSRLKVACLVVTTVCTMIMAVPSFLVVVDWLLRR